MQITSKKTPIVEPVKSKGTFAFVKVEAIATFNKNHL
jgi:hypothetical protein